MMALKTDEKGTSTLDGRDARAAHYVMGQHLLSVLHNRAKNITVSEWSFPVIEKALTFTVQALEEELGDGRDAESLQHEVTKLRKELEAMRAQHRPATLEPSQ